VFDCLVDSDQDYDKWEELEDDFVLMGNDGRPALQQRDSDQEDEPLQTPLDEYRLRMAALLPQATSVPAPALQSQLDANFDAFMEEEYAQDKIGELLEEEIENPTQIKDSLLLEAVDEFIEDKKMWFRDLHHRHGD
jgi:hypothetical protein